LARGALDRVACPIREHREEHKPPLSDLAALFDSELAVHGIVASLDTFHLATLNETSTALHRSATESRRSHARKSP
jgi:hypothetical protein